MNTMKRDVDGGIINRSGDGTYCRDYYAILFLSTAIVEVETVERERDRERYSSAALTPIQMALRMERTVHCRRARTPRICHGCV